MNDFDEKIVLITGGTSGIGKAVAKKMLDEGARVIVVGRDLEKGILIQQEFSNTDGRFDFIQCDVSNSDDVAVLFETINSKYGKLDILVNNAGIFRTYPLDEIDTVKWHEVFEINVESVMLITQKFMSLLETEHGCIVNVASIGGMSEHISGGKTYLYAASKAAVIQFSKLCALNYAKKVRVNCVCPGITDTPIYINRDFSRFSEYIPMGRVAQAEEIAEAVIFLSSSKASYITGAVLPVDGGAHLG